MFSPGFSRVAAWVVLLAGILLVSVAPLRVQAADAWPVRPIRYVVPWPAGGPSDVFGRVIASELSARLGQPVIVENRPGATGAIASQAVARSAPDGYILLAPNTVSFIGNVVASPETAGFDPLRDFTPVGLFVESELVLWAHRSSGIRTFEEFLARLHDYRAPPVTLGTTGNGTVSGLFVDLLAEHEHSALNLTRVPYKGTAPQVADLAAGHVEVGGTDYPSASGHYARGVLVPLLVIGKHRLPELPDVPASAERGIHGPDLTLWNGLVAPAGIPPTVLARLRSALERAVHSPAFRKVAEGQGNRVIFQTGEQAIARIRQELEEQRRLQARLSN